MKNKNLLIIFLALAVFIAGCANKKPLADKTSLNFSMTKKNLRQSSAAGKFYPSSPDILEKEIKFMMAENDFQNKDKVFALISPHAGYKYAGKIFASAYSTVKTREIKTVIIIGNSHHKYFDGISIYQEGAYETPLGEISIDADMVNNIKAIGNKIVFEPNAHETEHSIEVQLPFLQLALGKFKIVPIIMGNDLMDTCKLLSNVLKKIVEGRQDVLIVASSDMSHYPSYDSANRVDKEVLAMIQKGNARDLDELLAKLELRGIPNAVSFLCGAGAVKTIMMLANEAGASDIRVLKYSNSGDVLEDKTGVVGYGAVAFSFSDKKKEDKKIADEKKKLDVSQDDKNELLKIAKMSVEAKVKGEEISKLNYDSLVLNSNRGAFVTLRKGGKLRGCIGRFISDEPLYKVVQEMAQKAALADSRFSPVSLEELPELEYEISILSPLEKISDPYSEIELGKHGVQIRRGLKSGVFLPQVATEAGWDLETFMNQLCENKAGIPSNAWKNGEVEIYKFTADVVHTQENNKT